MSTKATSLKIFLSSGSAFTDQQKKFVQSFEEFLLRNGCQPNTVGQSIYSATQPVLKARQEIQSCDGAIVLAFARYEIEKATEYPGSRKQQDIGGMRLPTIWNHLEGGMAYGLDLPLLILVEKGLKRQGILSDRSEWFPQEIELMSSTLKDKAFVGVFEDWKKLASEQAQKKKQATKSLIAGMTMLELVSAIGVHTGVRVIIALGSLIGAVFGFGVLIGRKFG
jgi:hypothetical protein